MNKKGVKINTERKEGRQRLEENKSRINEPIYTKNIFKI